MRPCPFCESDGDLLEVRVGARAWVHCKICFCKGPMLESRHDAVEGWNTRKGGEPRAAEAVWHLLKEIIGNGNGAGRNPQIMIDTAVQIARTMGELE